MKDYGSKAFHNIKLTDVLKSDLLAHLRSQTKKQKAKDLNKAQPKLFKFDIKNGSSSFRVSPNLYKSNLRRARNGYLQMKDTSSLDKNDIDYEDK